MGVSEQVCGTSYAAGVSTVAGQCSGTHILNAPSIPHPVPPGPTNSGKTYQALQALAAAKRGVYCGPLRLLAMEVGGLRGGAFCTMRALSTLPSCFRRMPWVSQSPLRQAARIH